AVPRGRGPGARRGEPPGGREVHVRGGEPEEPPPQDLGAPHSVIDLHEPGTAVGTVQGHAELSERGPRREPQGSPSVVGAERPPAADKHPPRSVLPPAREEVHRRSTMSPFWTAAHARSFHLGMIRPSFVR